MSFIKNVIRIQMATFLNKGQYYLLTGLRGVVVTLHIGKSKEKEKSFFWKHRFNYVCQLLLRDCWLLLLLYIFFVSSRLCRGLNQIYPKWALQRPRALPMWSRDSASLFYALFCAIMRIMPQRKKEYYF